jgi:DMSO reductase anchor subunit
MKAWRSLGHLRKSWLSREILFLLAFAGLWVVLAGLRLSAPGDPPIWFPLAGAAALCGLAALDSMQNVYQLRSVPGWNTWRTRLEFAASTIGLGGLLAGVFLPPQAPAGARAWIAGAALLAFLAGGYVTLCHARTASRSLARLRAGLLLAGILGAGSLFFLPSSPGMAVLFLVALAEEAVGRWLFYARRHPSI